MLLNEILEDKKLNKMLGSYISENYKKYKVSTCYEYDDFKQEIYLYLIEKLPSFDETKSKISTFLYMCIATKSLNLVVRNNSKKRNCENQVSLNNTTTDKEGHQKEFIELLVDNVDIEKQYVDSELINYLLDYYKDNEWYTNLIILLSQGYTKRQLEREFGYCHTTIYKRIGKKNKINTLAYVTNKYIKESK